MCCKCKVVLICSNTWFGFYVVGLGCWVLGLGQEEEEKEEEEEEEEKEQQEEINFDQFLSWVESLYLKAKRYVLSFHFVLLV